MDFLILTGVSGAGKSKAIEALEDMGFFCVDNIPPKLILKFSELCMSSTFTDTGVAVVVDARSKEMFGDFNEAIDALKYNNIKYKLIFIDADDTVILNRFKETRRKHPMVSEFGSLDLAIQYERNLLSEAKSQSDYLIDTTSLSVSQLKEKIIGFFKTSNHSSIVINCVSFGFKNGIPHDVDLQYDVRCLINPFYEENLKRKTGLDQEVDEYIMSSNHSTIYLDKIFDFLSFVMPLYIAEGKSQLTIGIGCTGGKHRSVAFTERIGKFLLEKGYNVIITHRDIKK
ncbi:MAG: RNase adapter RapZ [Oscillospiraceae bacterium]